MEQRKKIISKFLSLGILFQAVVASLVKSFSLAFSGLLFFAWLLGNPQLFDNLVRYKGLKRYCIFFCLYFQNSVLTWFLLKVSLWLFEYLFSFDCLLIIVALLLIGLVCSFKLIDYCNILHQCLGYLFLVSLSLCFFFYPPVFDVLCLVLWVSLLYTEWLFREVGRGGIIYISALFSAALSLYSFRFYCIYSSGDMLSGYCGAVLEFGDSIRRGTSFISYLSI